MVAALAPGALLLVACGDFVNWIVGSYQPQDPSGADVATYLIIEAAPDSDQAKAIDVGKLVYIQASGGDKIGIRTVNGSFVDFTTEAGMTSGCFPVLPLTPIAVSSKVGSEALLLVELLARDDGGTGGAEAGTDAGASAPTDADAVVVDAEAGAGGNDAGSPCSCGPGYHAIRQAAAVVSDSLVVVVDGGIDAASSDGGAADAVSEQSDAATDGNEGG